MSTEQHQPKKTERTEPLTGFTHLHIHTHYSLLDGLSKIPDLLDRVQKLGMDSIAITDHGALYGAIEFYQEAKKRNIKPILGMEGYIAANGMADKTPGVDDKRYHITLLAKNNVGYQNLIELSTRAHLEGYYYKPRVDKALLRKHAEGIIALSGCLAAEIPSYLKAGNMARAEEALREYQDIFGAENFYLEVQRHDDLPEQDKVNEGIFALAEKLRAPVVATQDSHYLKREDAEAHDVLLAIQTGNKLADENRMKFDGVDSSLTSPEEMAEKFKDHPEVLENTQRIAQACNVDITFGEHQLPHFDVPEGYSDATYLEELCRKGLKTRYGITATVKDGVWTAGAKATPRQREIVQRLEYELSVINKTGFASYMLIVQDFVNWAKQQAIVVGPGRGSAAGSLVCYLTNVTNVDPIAFNLLFERFLNPARISMPDIDLDFADHRRDEVLRYVSQKYGENNVAQIITFGTMAARVSIRDVGRALDYPYSYCDRLAKMIPMFYSLDRSLAEVGELKQLYKTDAEAKRLIDIARRLEGVVRHASTHACGVVITKEPLTKTVPLQRSTSDENSIITQYELHAVEDLGLLKMDFLGLKNLTIIENTLNEIARRHNKKIDMDAIPIDDTKTYQLLQRGDCTGVFQLESGGMRRYLKELKPTSLEDIIAMVALYRPGPMELIPDYIARKHGRRQISYLHPKLEPILNSTYGIAVYQEQVLEIAREMAGFSYGEADLLRKAIGKKIRGLLNEQREKFVEGAVKKGTEKKVAEQLFQFIEPFANYGFNRAHAACYARIAYETAYLKAHYPTEFMGALLNAEQKNIERIAFLIDEANNHSIKILPPSINESGRDFTVANATDHGGTIRFGMAAVKNVGSNVVAEIIAERERAGAFTSLENLLERVVSRDFNKKSLESLTKAGALDAVGERNGLLENMDVLLQYAKEQQAVAASGQGNLFGELAVNTASASSGLRLKSATTASNRDKLTWEKELLGFYVTGHPLREHANKMADCTPIRSLAQYRFPSVRVAALVHSTKKIITKKGEPMMFMGLEDLTGKIEAIAFPKLFAKSQEFLLEGRMIIAEGKVDNKDGEPKLLCERIRELA